MKKQGFTLVEVIVAIAISAIFLPAIGTMLSLSLQTSVQSERFTQAHGLAQEGMEAIFNLKSQANSSWDWTDSPENTEANEYYQPTEVDGVWHLGLITENPIVAPQPFTRKVQIKEVRRCGGTICDDVSASVDINSRKITVSVSWPEKGETQKVELNAYVTKH